ncbi:MAG: hypothetical protein V3V19_11040 [Cocleimonas sp.]
MSEDKTTSEIVKNIFGIIDKETAEYKIYQWLDSYSNADFYRIDVYRDEMKRDWFDPVGRSLLERLDDIKEWLFEPDKIKYTFVIKTFEKWVKADFIDGKYTNWTTLIEDPKDYKVLLEMAKSISNMVV